MLQNYGKVYYLSGGHSNPGTKKKKKKKKKITGTQEFFFKTYTSRQPRNIYIYIYIYFKPFINFSHNFSRTQKYQKKIRYFSFVRRSAVII